jgi:hypothetical protein
MLKRFVTLTSVFILFSVLVYGQHSTDELLGQDTEVNTITTAVPFLMISPDSRGGGMGDAGVATSPDGYSQHYNPAKYAFIDRDLGFSISYTPWLRNLIDDIHLLYASGFVRYDKKQTLAASLRYFSLGDIIFTDIVGNTTGQFKPNEFSFDLSYSRLLSRNFSGGIALRYIHSNLTGGVYVEGTESHPGNAVASDVSFYYQNEVSLAKKDGLLAFGINLSNIGSKISYTENAEKDFIPANMKLGGAYKLKLDDYNSFMLTADINKLLVPTPPIYGEETDPEGNQVIAFGKDPNVSVVSGIFQSFFDAPGVIDNGSRNVFKEEMREINYSVGAEYWYANQFGLRAGYFFEHPTKGNREFFTFGLGLKLNVFSLDFSYLVSTSSRHPLAETLRFSLNFNLEKFQQTETSKSKTS